ncbi:hypothetical protein DPX16_22805 [Anabarilius grahami]|uniref:Uncharacterized protein n=1 Tax=Anabarilius grahami TaxID=495550 RepID=A0A3N0ZA70_ANAGA|nr:hypothetical protein DPX16_22805 [Anabarilius grahami]
MSLTAALLNGDIVDPEDEEDDDDGPLNPTTLKLEWERMSGTIWLLLSKQESRRWLMRMQMVSGLNPQSHPAPTYVQLCKIMERASSRLRLPLEQVKKETVHGRFVKRFLFCHNSQATVSFSFLLDLHTEIEKAWKDLFAFINISRLFR